MQKAGASSEDNALSPRDVTTEVIVTRKALTGLLAEQAGRTGSPSSHSAQDPNLAVVLDFTAALVADLTYAKKFADKITWNRCVGVYIAPWLPDQGDHGAAFAESVCKHFYAIEKVGVPQGFWPPPHLYLYRPNTLPLMMGSQKRANFSVILSSLSHMVHFFSYRTLP